MGRYIGPKLRKRQLFGLSEASESIRRRNVRPVRRSGYGLILLEKQKLKFIYGIMERQMRRYAREAIASKNDPQVELLQRLESRLDNIVYRLGLAKTREQARQLVNHGHILVDAKKVSIPSYSLKAGQVIAVKDKLMLKALFKDQLKNNRETLEALSFLEFNDNGGRFLNIPKASELPKNVDMAKVIGFYHLKL